MVLNSGVDHLLEGIIIELLIDDFPQVIDVYDKVYCIKEFLAVDEMKIIHFNQLSDDLTVHSSPLNLIPFLFYVH